MPTESPKWIALGLSLVAIIVSGLSWWESHYNRVINEEVNRPILMTDTIQFKWPSKEPDLSYVYYWITVKNVGKISATLEKQQVRARIVVAFPKSTKDWGPLMGDCQVSKESTDVFMNPRDFGSGVAFAGQQIPSGTTFAIGHSAVLSPACFKSQSLMFSVSVEISYVDTISGRHFSLGDGRFHGASGPDKEPQQLR